MKVVVGALAFVLLVVLAVLGRQLRVRKQKPLSLSRKVPVFKAIVLGLQGSGKTLLLTSIYHRLQTPAEDQSYFLTAPRDDVLRLNKWYRQMADASRPDDWPHGTTKGETRKFTFSLKTRAAMGTLYEVLQIDYLEYPGELLTELQEEGSAVQATFLEHVESADALLCVIDGEHIRRHLLGDPRGQVGLRHTLNALVPHTIEEASCAVNFVITKWDLLTGMDLDEQNLFDKVRELLMSNSQFRALVDLHSKNRPVRLIPVSAVGPSFASVSAEGNIIKVAQAEVDPTNVDVPLSAVVPDLFEQRQKRLDQEIQAALVAEVQRRTNNPLEALSSLGKFAGEQASRGIAAALGTPTAAVSSGFLELFLASQAGKPSEKQLLLAKELNDVQRDIQTFHNSCQQVLYEMRDKVRKLEESFPTSRLDRRV
jgi:GTPase SAR1 family protein